MDARFPPPAGSSPLHPSASSDPLQARGDLGSSGTGSTLPPVAANPADDAYRAKATEAAVKFESFFIGQLLHKMRESARSVGERDKQEDSINRDMLDMADNLVADQLANRRAFGIADSLLRQLLPPPAAPQAPQNSAVETSLTNNMANKA